MNAWTRITLAATTLSVTLCAGGLFAQQPDAHQKPKPAAQRQGTQQSTTAKAQNQGTQKGSGGPAAPLVVVPVPVPVYEVKASEISAHPERYYGNMVSVTSGVEDIPGPNLFTLDADRLLPPHRDLVVVTPRPVKVEKGKRVHVIGHLRPLVMAQLARDYNWFKVNWFREVDVKIKLEEQPVIVAASVQTEDGRELLPPAK
jgi:hypothetical protein